MKSFQRASSIEEVAAAVQEGADAGCEVKDFLHEFKRAGRSEILEVRPAELKGKVERGEMLDAYLQALAVYLAHQRGWKAPVWTWPPIQLADPWFASPGWDLRNYLLISSPAPFRTRNLFIDEDSLVVY